ncbi:UNVERIFIED_CONTAM: multidrug resistance efflux pump [Acetivibrio alkalicellulosi]
MSKQVKSIEQLKDSRLLYDKKLPEIGYIIILAVVALLITVTVWSIRTPKINVIRSTGTVQSTNKNHVMSPYGGQIVEINIEEGILVTKGDVLLTVKSTDLDLQAKQLEGKKDLFLNQISKLKRLAESIKDNVNYFDESNEEDSLYYYEYKSYESKIAQNEIDTSAYKAYGYSDEQVETEIQKNKNKVAEIYYSTLKGVEDKILQYQSELDSAKVQLNAIKKGQNEYQVRANATGKIHMLADYKIGMVVQAGSAIANIASEMDEYKIQAYLSSDSLARISEGDKVDIAISGLAQTVYGTITGRVERIDGDITNDSENNTSYFKVDIVPDNTYLISKDGYKVNLSNGMPVEARIQYDKVSYFNFMLESLGLLIR